MRLYLVEVLILCSVFSSALGNVTDASTLLIDDDGTPYEVCYEVHIAKSKAIERNCEPCDHHVDCTDLPGKTCYHGMAAKGTRKGCTCYTFYGWGGRNECKVGSKYEEFDTINRGANVIVWLGSLLNMVIAALGVAYGCRALRGSTYRLVVSSPNVQTLLFGVVALTFLFGMHTGNLLVAIGIDAYGVFETGWKDILVGLGFNFTIASNLNVSACFRFNSGLCKLPPHSLHTGLFCVHRLCGLTSPSQVTSLRNAAT